MMQIPTRIALICLFLFGIIFTKASAQTLLNELDINPPATDNPCEYVEIRGTAGAALSNLYFVAIEGDGAASGTADFVVNLSGQTLGSNGLLIIVSPTACPGRTIPAETTQVTDAQLNTAGGGIENGTNSFLLVSSSTALTEGTDYDADNNGTPEALPSGAAILDAVGWTDGDAGDLVYGGVVLTQTSGTPDAATRFPSVNTANSASAWYNGDLNSAGANSSTAYSTTIVSSNFPAGGALTPGAPNVGTFVLPKKAPVDFNGDGKTDYSVLRNVNNQLFWFNSLNGTAQNNAVQWGLPSDFPVPADYDGDQKSDLAVWRPTGLGDPSRAYFFILQSSSNTVRTEQFGAQGDDPTIVGDYDGDNKADLAVFRAGDATAQAFWFYRPSNAPGTDFVVVRWGLGADFPYPGDYDADGKYDFVVQRDDDGQGVFYLLKSSGGSEVVRWGLITDEIVPGDYDGDNQNDFCVVRTDANNNSAFYLLTRSGTTQYINFGRATDLRVPGDYNGDGRTDLAVWRAGAANGASAFYVRQTPASSTEPAAEFVYQWGLGNDYPVANFLVQ